MKISNTDLLNKLSELVVSERKITHSILLHISEVEKRKLYFSLGFNSMFSYLTEHLKYSEGAALRRLKASRLLDQVPVLGEKIKEGGLKLNQLAQLQSEIREVEKTGMKVSSERKQEVLSLLENQTGFETEKILAKEFNHEIRIQTVAKPQKDESVRLEVTLTKEQWELLQKAKSDLSHLVPDGNWADVLAELAKREIKSREPKRTLNANAQFASAPEVKMNSAATITKQMRQQVFNRAQHHCEHIDLKTKHKCKSTYQLQVDHKWPKALGGGNNLSNLRVLCGAHNREASRECGL